MSCVINVCVIPFESRDADDATCTTGISAEEVMKAALRDIPDGDAESLSLSDDEDLEEKDPIDVMKM